MSSGVEERLLKQHNTVILEAFVYLTKKKAGIRDIREGTGHSVWFRLASHSQAGQREDDGVPEMLR